METCNKACAECHGKHEENIIWTHDAQHVEYAMQTMWKMHMENIIRRMHSNYVENCIWTHDFKHVVNAMPSMRSIAYGDTI